MTSSSPHRPPPDETIIVLDDDDDDDDDSSNNIDENRATFSMEKGDAEGGKRKSPPSSFHAQDIQNFDATKESTLYTGPSAKNTSFPTPSYGSDEEFSDLEDIFGKKDKSGVDKQERNENENENETTKRTDTVNVNGHTSPDTEPDDFLPVARARRVSSNENPGSSGSTTVIVTAPGKSNFDSDSSVDTQRPAKRPKLGNQPTASEEVLRTRNEAVLSAPLLTRSTPPQQSSSVGVAAGRSYYRKSTEPEKSTREPSKCDGGGDDNETNEDDEDFIYTQQPKIANKGSEYYCDICGKDLSGKGIKARMNHLSTHKKDPDVMGAIVAQRVAKNTAGDKTVARSNSILSRYFSHSITEDAAAKKKHKKAKRPAYTKGQQTEDLFPKSLEEEELMVAQALSESSLDGAPAQKFDLAGFPINESAASSNRSSEHFAVKARKIFGERTNSLIAVNNGVPAAKPAGSVPVFSESALLKKFSVIGKPSLWNEASFRKDENDVEDDNDDIVYNNDNNNVINDNDNNIINDNNNVNDNNIINDKNDNYNDDIYNYNTDDDVDNNRKSSTASLSVPNNLHQNDFNNKDSENEMSDENKNDNYDDNNLNNKYKNDGKDDTNTFTDYRDDEGHVDEQEPENERQPPIKPSSAPNSPVVISIPSRSQSESQNSSQRAALSTPLRSAHQPPSSAAEVLSQKTTVLDDLFRSDIFAPLGSAETVQDLRHEKERIMQEIRREADAAVERINSALEAALATLRSAQIRGAEDLVCDDTSLGANFVCGGVDDDWDCMPPYDSTNVVDLVDGNGNGNDNNTIKSHDDDNDNNIIKSHDDNGNDNNIIKSHDDDNDSSDDTAVLDEYMAKLDILEKRKRRKRGDDVIPDFNSNSGYKDDKMVDTLDDADIGNDDEDDDGATGNVLNRDALEFMTRDKLARYVRSYGMKPGTRKEMIGTLKSVRERQNEQGIEEIFSKTISQGIAHCIKLDETIYSRILLYEGVSVKAVKERLKSEWGLNVPEKILKNYFEAEAVAFTK